MVPPLGVSKSDTYVFGLSLRTGYAMTLAPSKSSARRVTISHGPPPLQEIPRVDVESIRQLDGIAEGDV